MVATLVQSHVPMARWQNKQESQPSLKQHIFYATRLVMVPLPVNVSKDVTCTKYQFWAVLDEVQELRVAA
jgi:hypothetical protein